MMLPMLVVMVGLVGFCGVASVHPVPDFHNGCLPPGTRVYNVHNGEVLVVNGPEPAPPGYQEPPEEEDQI